MILRIERGKFPQKIELPKFDQQVQMVNLPDKTTCVIVINPAEYDNQPNRALLDDTYHMVGIIPATFYIVGIKPDGLTDLTDDDLRELEEKYHYPNIFTQVDGRVIYGESMKEF